MHQGSTLWRITKLEETNPPIQAFGGVTFWIADRTDGDVFAGQNQNCCGGDSHRTGKQWCAGCETPLRTSHGAKVNHLDEALPRRLRHLLGQRAEVAGSWARDSLHLAAESVDAVA